MLSPRQKLTCNILMLPSHSTSLFHFLSQLSHHFLPQLLDCLSPLSPYSQTPLSTFLSLPQSLQFLSRHLTLVSLYFLTPFSPSSFPPYILPPLTFNFHQLLSQTPSSPFSHTTFSPCSLYFFYQLPTPVISLLPLHFHTLLSLFLTYYFLILPSLFILSLFSLFIFTPLTFKFTSYFHNQLSPFSLYFLTLISLYNSCHLSTLSLHSLPISNPLLPHSALCYLLCMLASTPFSLCTFSIQIFSILEETEPRNR